MTSIRTKAARGDAVWPVLGAVALLAGVTAAAIGALSLVAALTATGLPDPGPMTSLGLPFVRAVGELAAAVAIGGFMFAAFFVPPQASGVLDADGYRALRLATAATGVWAVCAALLVPLTVSDVSGEPLFANLSPAAVWRAADLVDTASAWRWTAALAAVVAVSATAVLRWSWTPVLLAGALLTLMPLALTGHSASGGSHDLATSSLMIHLVAGSLWAGGLLALLAHALRGGGHTALAARRFSAVALCCFVAMVLSGTVNAAVRVRLSDLLSTPYGVLVIGKVVALATLGAVGWRQRRSAVTALQSDPGARAPLIRLAMAETLVFGATFGIAVGLGRTPPPPPSSRDLSPAAVALGYDLAGPPTMARFLLDWRFDLLFGTAAIGLAVVYVVGVIRLSRRSEDWPARRSVAWLLGCGLLLFTTSSGVGRYLPAMFSVHLTAHLLLAMLVPLLLVLGAPTTLALRALPAASQGDPPGPREWLRAGLQSPCAHLLTHPGVATVLFAAGFYALYLGGVFDAAVADHAAHVLMNLQFLISGYLFYWVVIGVDAMPRVVPQFTRIRMICTAILLYALFGVVLMEMTGVLGQRFYRSLELPWHTNLSGDQHLGASITLVAGVLLLIAVMAVLLIQWRPGDRWTAPRWDRPAWRDDGTDEAVRNAMPAEPARRDH